MNIESTSEVTEWMVRQHMNRIIDSWILSSWPIYKRMDEKDNKLFRPSSLYRQAEDSNKGSRQP